MEGHAVKTQLHHDRTARLITAVGAGVLVFVLVVLFACLIGGGESRGGSSRHCPAHVGTVDLVTCLPYGSAGTPPAATNHSGSGSSTARKPAQPKAPAVKAPVAPAPRAPAAPPRVSLGKR